MVEYLKATTRAGIMAQFEQEVHPLQYWAGVPTGKGPGKGAQTPDTAGADQGIKETGMKDSG